MIIIVITFLSFLLSICCCACIDTKHIHWKVTKYFRSCTNPTPQGGGQDCIPEELPDGTSITTWRVISVFFLFKSYKKGFIMEAWI